MNGRVYDPHIGRFLSADPFIQQPENVQSFNRYSYVLNNPLAYVDASGFLFGFIKKAFKKVLNIGKKIVKGIVNVAKNVFNPQRLLRNILTVAAYIGCGPAGPACAAGVSAGFTAANGGSVGEILFSAVTTIYACGDVAGPWQFTHTAGHQAWYAAINALFIKRFRMDTSVIPWATFTDPEVARVGLNEQEAKQQNIPYETSVYPMDDLDRAIAEGATEGFVKVLTVPGKDKILGATIVGEHGGELITEYITAMKNKLGLNKILGTIHIYPTFSEANKYTAGVWKKAHAPQSVLALLKKYHHWMLR